MAETSAPLDDNQEVEIKWTSTCTYEQTWTIAELREALGDDEDCQDEETGAFDLDLVSGGTTGELDSLLADEETINCFTDVTDREVLDVVLLPRKSDAACTSN